MVLYCTFILLVHLEFSTFLVFFLYSFINFEQLEKAGQY